MDYLVAHTEKLEEGAINNLNLKVNVAAEDPCYHEATNLAAFMGERVDVDAIQNML